MSASQRADSSPNDNLLETDVDMKDVLALYLVMDDPQPPPQVVAMGDSEDSSSSHSPQAAPLLEETTLMSQQDALDLLKKRWTSLALSGGPCKPGLGCIANLTGKQAADIAQEVNIPVLFKSLYKGTQAIEAYPLTYDYRAYRKTHGRSFETLQRFFETLQEDEKWKRPFFMALAVRAGDTGNFGIKKMSTEPCWLLFPYHPAWSREDESSPYAKLVAKFAVGTSLGTFNGLDSDVINTPDKKRCIGDVSNPEIRRHSEAVAVSTTDPLFFLQTVADIKEAYNALRAKLKDCFRVAPDDPAATLKEVNDFVRHDKPWEALERLERRQEALFKDANATTVPQKLTVIRENGSAYASGMKEDDPYFQQVDYDRRILTDTLKDVKKYCTHHNVPQEKAEQYFPARTFASILHCTLPLDKCKALFFIEGSRQTTPMKWPSMPTQDLTHASLRASCGSWRKKSTKSTPQILPTKY